jgi:hypothetical protein
MTKYDYESVDETINEMGDNSREVTNTLTLFESVFGTIDDMKENPERAERQLRERADSGELFKNILYVLEKLNPIAVQLA